MTTSLQDLRGSPFSRGASINDYVALAAAVASGNSVVALQTGGTLTLPQSDATNYTDIPGLSVTLLAGTYVLCDAYVEAEGTTTADIRVRFALPGGSTLVYSGSWSTNGIPSSATTGAGTLNKTAYTWVNSTSVIGLIGSGAPISFSPSGLIVVTTAGAIKMQATQGTADASNVLVRNGFLRFRKVA